VPNYPLLSYRHQMIKIEVYPLKGIKIENVGEINLGQTKSEVERLLGKSFKTFDDKRLYYHNYEFRIDIDEFLNVEFIEFLSGPFPEKIKLSLYNIDPFQIGADNLFALLAEKNNGEIDKTEADYCYCFINISVGIWRQITQKSVEESIAEMILSGEYQENKDSLAEELEKSKNYWTVGIGVPNYYS
jgi:hypothetical protein